APEGMDHPTVPFDGNYHCICIGARANWPVLPGVDCVRTHHRGGISFGGGACQRGGHKTRTDQWLTIPWICCAGAYLLRRVLLCLCSCLLVEHVPKTRDP